MISKHLNNLVSKLVKPRKIVPRFQTTAVFHDPELTTAKSFDEMPSEKSFPLIGASWLYFPLIGSYHHARRHEASMKRCLKYGKIVREDITPNFKVVHLFDVKDIEKMYRYEGRYPIRMPIKSVKFFRDKRKYSNAGFIGELGIISHEPRSKVRKHLLSPTSVQYYLPATDSTSREFVEKVGSTLDSNGEVPEFMNELYKWSLETVLLVVLDTKMGCLSKDNTSESEAWKMVEAINYFNGVTYKFEFSPLKLWRVFPFPKISKFFKCMDFMSNTTQKYMKIAIAKREESSVENRNVSLLENLLITEKIDPAHVNTMVADMVTGSVDTTSHTTAFALYLLAKNQDCQQRVYEEISKVLPDHSSPITVDVLNECRYLKAALKESIRLIPAVSGNVRILDEDIVFSGYRIPAGTVILAQTLVVTRLEENFSEPMKYKPERWLREVNEEKLKPFAYLPFGFGPRSCLGKRIAEQEMWTLLIRIFQKYRLEYHYEDMDVLTRLVNGPDKPLRLKFIER